MNFPKITIFFLICILISGLMGCGDIRPIWKEEQNLREKGYTLYFSEPCEFEMDLQQELTEATEVMLELSITYYVKISRTNLPLFLVIEDENHNRREFLTNVLIKDEGEWLGIPDEDGVDYTISHIAIKELKLEKGIYKLKIYSDDQNFEQIEGVVKLGVRLFELDDLQDEDA